MLGLLFQLSKGWYIYWKNAGGTGSPPQLALTQPAHVTTGAFAWPAPDWLVANRLGDYVVSGTVLLSFTVSLPRAVPAEGIDLCGKADSLVCSVVICVPQQASFDLHLAEPAASPSTDKRAFRVRAWGRAKVFAVRIDYLDRRLPWCYRLRAMIRGEAPARSSLVQEQPLRQKQKITLIQLLIVIAHITMSNTDILHQYTLPTGAPNVF